MIVNTFCTFHRPDLVCSIGFRIVDHLRVQLDRAYIVCCVDVQLREVVAI